MATKKKEVILLDGPITTRKQLENGLTEITIFEDDGKTIFQRYCEDKDGSQNGLYEELSNGKPRLRYFLKNDIYDGLYEVYDEKGLIQLRCHYKNGELNGLYETFYSNGKIKEKCYYENNRKNGPYELRDIKGKVIKSEFLLNDMPIPERYKVLIGLSLINELKKSNERKLIKQQLVQQFRSKKDR